MGVSGSTFPAYPAGNMCLTGYPIARDKTFHQFSDLHNFTGKFMAHGKWRLKICRCYKGCPFKNINIGLAQGRRLDLYQQILRAYYRHRQIKHLRSRSGLGFS
jgi:hypothetical protein